MHQRRETEHQQDEQAFIVDEELVQHALVIVAGLLQVAHKLLPAHSALIRAHVDAESLDEDAGDRPHLVHVGQRPVLDVLVHARLDVLLRDLEAREREPVLRASVGRDRGNLKETNEK